MTKLDDKQTRFKLLTRAVSSWLAYKHLTGMAGLLNEATLSVPVAEFLTHNTRYDIVGQEPHPNFPGKGIGGGRRLDFVAKTAGGGWVFVIETKTFPLVREGFVDDLLRLALLKKPGTLRYFLVAGELPSSDWRYLKTARNKAKGQITGATRVPFRLLVNVKGSPRKDLVRLFLRDDYKAKTVDLKNISKVTRKYLKSFQKRYRQRTIPGRYVTTLKSYSRKNRFVAVIWEIKIKQGGSITSFLT